MQVDHGEGTVPGIVAEFERCFALLNDPLENHPVHRAMSHAFLMLHEVSFGVFGKINGLRLADAVMRRQRHSPLFRPMSQGLLVRVRAPELNDRTILENSPT